jgi:tetratricopeptide (TPR) repeat protein
MATMLSQAIAHHREGRFAQAALAYEAVIAAEPGNAQALLLLGILKFERGDPAAAAGFVERAVQADPANALYHANLAEIYRALGQLDRSVACCRTAIALDARNAEAHCGLGSALLAHGDAAGAVDAFREAIRLRPGYAMAHNNLGSALRRLGDRDAALRHFREAVGLEPTLVEARSNLGQVLLETGNPGEALMHCREAVRLRPQFAEAHNNLGNALKALGQLDEARHAYEHAVQLAPNLALAYNNLGQLFHEQGRHDEAAVWYRRALERAPSSALLHFNLANALSERGIDADAIRHFESAIALKPDYAEAHHGLGTLQHYHGHSESAEASFRAAIAAKAELAAAHASLGGMFEEQGDFDRAGESFRTALRHDPKNHGALARMATMLRGALAEPEEGALRAQLSDASVPESKRWPLLFALAQVADARGSYDEAATLVRDANRLRIRDLRYRGQVYDREAHRVFVDHVIAAADSEFFTRVRGSGSATERPVFIVGLPRSGTTLVEQILASHSKVHGAGELFLIPELFDSLPRLTGTAGSLNEALGHVNANVLTKLSEAYLARLSLLAADAERVIDKMPHNYLYLGYIAAMFPNARLIHCRRDVRDVALSCWITNFAQMNWTSDADDIASRVAEYRRLMAHWHAVMPAPVLEVDYERLVSDLEGESRRLIAWCGLDWEPACLEFHKTRRLVRTASAGQVRQPLYTRSVGRWKHYEQALAALFEKVEGA